jgi:signal transduction histidine kinase
MFSTIWNRVHTVNSNTSAGRAIRWLGGSTAVLLLLTLLLHFGSKRSPADFLASEEQRLSEQLNTHQLAFEEWVSLCEAGGFSALNRWGAAAQQVGLPDWQLQVFRADSLMYWSQGRLTASEDALFGSGWMRLPRQICWRYDSLVGMNRYRFTLPLLVYQSGNWRFCDPQGRIMPGKEAVEFLWHGKPTDQRPWYPYRRAEARLVSWRTANAVDGVQMAEYGLWVARLSLLASLFLGLLLILIIRNRPMPLTRKLMLWVLALLSWRLLLLPLSVFCGWERLAWFDPGLFASHRLLPSLGDLWLYMAMLWAIPATLALYPAAVWRALLQPLRKELSGVGRLLLLFGTLCFSTLSWLVTRDLLVNGGIPLSFNELTGLNAFTLPAFIAVVALVLLNTLVWGVWMRCWLLQAPPRTFIIQMLLSAGLWLGVLSFTGEGAWLRGLPELWMPLLVIVLFFYLLHKQGSGFFKRLRHPHMGQSLSRVLLVYFSLAAAYQLADGGARRQANRASLVAARLTNPYDERAITELSAMIPRLRADSLLLSGIYGNESSPERWQSLITLGHLTGYLDRYQLVETCFLPDLRADSVIDLLDSSRIRAVSMRKVLADTAFAQSGAVNSPSDTISSVVEVETLPSAVTLIRQFTEQARQGFGINVPLPQRSGRSDTLYLRLLRRDPVASGGMWGLAANRTLEGDDAYPEFSFALYRNGLLQRSNGSITYPLRDRDLNRSRVGASNDSAKEDRRSSNVASVGLVREAQHIITPLNDGGSLVVSFRPQDWLDLPAMGIALLLSAWLLILLTEGVRRLGRSNLRWQLGYRERIGLGLVATGLVTVVAGGYATLAYSVRSREASQQDNLAARLEDLYTALAPLLNEDVLNRTTSSAQYLVGPSIQPLSSVIGVDDYRLAEMARRMQVDFALYDGQGRLLYSSLPEVDRLPFVTQRLAPLAWTALAREGQSRYVHGHQQGWVDAWSAYRPIFPRGDRLAGVLQMVVPRSDAVGKTEYNAFLGNLFRLYLLLLLFSFVLSYGVARRITRPIRALTLQMMRNRHGEKAPMGGYPRHDEVGLLIHSYNELLLELQESARLLAKSEREQTWRQVARQIAHEIRNPLTPMKLKLQRLLRDRSTHPDRFEERLSEDLSVVLEQIDVLAAVSDEFGAFARSEPLKKAVFDLRDGIQPAVALFGHIGLVDFVDHLSPDDPGTMMGDVQQIQRVFQNLLRNAQQAVAEGVEPRVRIELKRDGMHYTVLVADNGQGIPESFKERIFEPNFTTKGSGMGLGLAIVSRIVEQHAGVIKFETAPGIGTQFTLEFPSIR